MKYDQMNLIQQRIKEIQELLLIATRQHFNTLMKQSTDNSLYGYTLYTSDDASGVGPVANYENNIKVDIDDSMYLYYRYSADEWTIWDDFGLFEDVNNSLREVVDNYDEDKIDWVELREGIFSMFLVTLEELKKENLFIEMGSKPFLAVWPSDTCSKIINKSAKILNDEDIYSEFCKEFSE